MVYSISIGVWIASLMLTKYILSTFNGDHRDVNHVKIFTSILINLKILHIDILQARETIRN